jgi:hypothetical protein
MDFSPPAFAMLALTASEAAAWVALVGAIGSVVIGIIGALKGAKAEGKADAADHRADALAAGIRQTREQIHDVAKQMDPPPKAQPRSLRPMTPDELRRFNEAAAASRAPSQALRPGGLVGGPQVDET